MTGILAMMVGMGQPYKVPALLGVVNSTVTGSGTANPIANVTNSSGFAYANRVISGKVYWETVILCGIPIFGIAQSTTGLGEYGGHSTGNGLGSVALYSYNGTLYRDGGSAASADPELVRDVGKRIGIAVDTVAKTITYYFGGVAQQTFSINTTKLNAGPLYPHVGAQIGFAMSGETCGDGSIRLQFCFGPTACVYAPPSGFIHY